MMIGKKEDDILFSILSREYTNYLNHISNMNPAFLKYFSNYVNGVQLNDCGYQIQRTTPGEYYDWHCDSDITALFSMITIQNLEDFELPLTCGI